MKRKQSEGSDRYSISSYIRSEYDAFLSFRGPDTRYGIVDHLYQRMTEAGLRVFKDDEEIHHGELIGGELERAIRGSRVYAVVFSRDYASSAWCLRELDMMVDLCRGSNVSGKIILPIFYGADPADVKLRSELYRKALDAHRDRHGQDVVRKWEEALKKVGGISGWDTKAIQGEGRFVRLIVQDIFGKLRIKDQSLPDHLTGIDDRVSDMLNLLDCDSSGVRLVVLHGMGGIGKTTLASAVFNELHSRFEASSFLSNVRESATDHGGIAKLQKKLRGDILGGQHKRSCNSDGGFSEIIQRIRGKRMLLVLDDVGQFSQLEKLVGKDPEGTLGTSSRVIITTRDKSVCNLFVRPGSKLLHFFEMEKMDDHHALQLFSRRAFGTDEPPRDYLSLSEQVVETTGNLPLALVVIAGHLCCQSKMCWEDMLKELKNIPRKEVFEILKVSYDGLGWREKEIFLDIACFRQNGMFQRYAYYFWEGRGLYPESGVKELVYKSLIKIDSRGEFSIHDQLRDMGREIIRSKGHGRPEKRTRIWDPKEALEIVLQNQFSREIIAMKLGRYGDEIYEFFFESDGDERYEFFDENDGDEGHEFSHESDGHQGEEFFFESDGDERYEFFDENDGDEGHEFSYESDGDEGHEFCDENFRGLSQLLYLHLDRAQLTGDFGNLRDKLMWLSWSGCRKQFNSEFFRMRNLVVLIISGGGWRGVEKLIMPKLRVLVVSDNFFSRNDMRMTPDVSCCSNLEIMVFKELDSLEEIHHSVGKLERLTYLKIGRCPSLRRLPKELGCARALQDLIVTYCHIEEVPESIGMLEYLTILDLRVNKIRRLPSSICDLKNLLVLDAMYCPLEEGIPDEIGKLSTLKKLDLSSSEIRFLPATISGLTSLESLNLSRCKMLQEIRGLPTSLKIFDASYCPLEKGITEEIGKLSTLKELYLSNSKISFLPETISLLTSLEYLNLRHCEMLREIRGLPTSLKILDASNCPLEEEIGNLLSLERLYLLCNKIHFLPATISQLTNLEDLRLDGCGMLQEHRRLPTSLTYFEFSGMSVRVLLGEDGMRYTKIKFREAYELGFLSRLKTLGLSSPDMVSLQTHVEIRDFTWTEMEVVGLDLLPSLMELSIMSADRLLRVSNIGRLRSGLRSLRLFWCRALVEIPGLEQLELLEELILRGCLSISEIQDLLGLKRLKGVYIRCCCSLVHVPRLIDECRLLILECKKLEDFEGSYGEYHVPSSISS